MRETFTSRRQVAFREISWDLVSYCYPSHQLSGIDYDFLIFFPLLLPQPNKRLVMECLSGGLDISGNTHNKIEDISQVFSQQTPYLSLRNRSSLLLLDNSTLDERTFNACTKVDFSLFLALCIYPTSIWGKIFRLKSSMTFEFKFVFFKQKRLEFGHCFLVR